MAAREGALSRSAEERFFAGLEETSRFFMGQSDVHKALVKLVAALEELGTPYAIIGALAMNEFGYQRATVEPSTSTGTWSSAPVVGSGLATGPQGPGTP
jgi:hypothetical protein